MDDKEREMYKKHLKTYLNLMPFYKQFTKILKRIFKYIVDEFFPSGMIYTKIQSLSNFLDNLSSPNEIYTDPFKQINDICELYVILPNFDNVNSICELIQDYFVIFSKKSENNFIIQLKENLGLYEKLDFNIPNEVFSLKGKIKVLTFLEYCWSINKKEIKPFRQFLDEQYEIFAVLRNADKSLNTLIQKVHEHKLFSREYLSFEKIQEKIEKLELIHSVDLNNIDIAYEIARLALEIYNFDKTINILKEVLNMKEWKSLSNSKSALILRDLGISICKKKVYKPEGDDYKQGQKYLKDAVRLNPKDSDTYAALGGTYIRQQKEADAHECYKLALKINDSNPYPLVNYLIYEIWQNNNLNPLIHNRDRIRKAIEKRLKDCYAMIDIPWSFYDVSLLFTFVGKEYENILNYIMAIRLSSEIWMIDITMNTLNKLKKVQNKLPGIHLARILLLLGIAFHSKAQNTKTNKVIEIKNHLKALEMEQMETDIEGSIVILSGGVSESIERDIDEYRDNLIESFQDFKCIIISNGINFGISGIVGDIQEKYPDKIKTIGYVPEYISDKTIEIDKRYSKIHKTKNVDFSFLEILQYWYDIFESEIDPRTVKLIGINGGKISALEYRLAITFGAQVGVIGHSGYAASDLIIDPMWNEQIQQQYNQKIIKLFKNLRNSTEDIKNFLEKPFIRGELSVFVSYSNLDSEYFQIQKVRESLRNYSEIGEVLIYEVDSDQDIVDYMQENLDRCDVFVLFCSENAKKSKSVRAEWKAAFQLKQRDRLKIVPVYENEDHVPNLLLTNLIVKFKKDDFEGFIKALHHEITR